MIVAIEIGEANKVYAITFYQKFDNNLDSTKMNYEKLSPNLTRLELFMHRLRTSRAIFTFYELFTWFSSSSFSQSTERTDIIFRNSLIIWDIVIIFCEKNV